MPHHDVAALTLPANPESVRTARRFVAERVSGCPADVAADAVLLTSELATNCVMHARTDFVLQVLVDPGGVRVEIADQDPDLPCLDDAGDHRGLVLVRDLAAEWGAERAEDGRGKVVWFLVRGT